MQGSESNGRRRPIIVQKYGGSSVADVEKLGRVADRVVAAKRAGNDVVVVVSAMGKTTDGLLSLARQVASQAGGAADPPRRELDMLLSTGERVSMALLSIAIQARGEAAISFTGSQSGILTNDRHFDARIIEVRPHRIEDELARGQIVIIAGYQGMSYRREITTLGRGGSDTTAVALAAALEAERCEIYSDVDGVYSADPRVVPDAQHLPELDHAMLQEMAECGAKVVCAQAVEWARRANIAIYARSTFDAEEEGSRQTVVRKFGPREDLRARAVVGEGNVALGSLPDVARLDDLLRVAGEAKVPLKDLAVNERGASFVVSLLNVPDWRGAKQRLTGALPSLALVEDVAVVSVVGDGLAATTEPLARFLAALRAVSATPSALTATPLRLSAVVPASALAEAQRALHRAFVES
ncbi:aspartate kinase [Polyangium sp. y55x31]|uniref:aspartate kinase n=1 Tax=Polyangium sp. y55x31 TaxID=3042688 RepID=UPI002482A68E|nr:aspartate kinase [Polyangium sp. y55x31]MDI1476594.1 aspartate kinase [Polyangium sp. y55x31]